MARSFPAIGFLLSFTLLGCQGSMGAQTCPVVRTSCGLLQGTLDKPSGSCAFLGIPYALPPVGHRRWLPPELLARGPCWNSTLNAISPGLPCLQRGTYSKGSNSSEDCLRLHVHTKNTPRMMILERDLKPTLVWLHGGGLVEGSPFAIQSGFGAQANLTTRNEAVVVSVQYRLGVAGFLSLRALRHHDPRGISGNYGLLDCIAALQWIQQNIQAFGGNPRRVTVWGQSSGGSLVLALAASPHSRGLMHGGISMSGSPRLNSTTKEAERYWHREVVMRSRCASIGFKSSDEKRMLECLLSLDEEELLEAMPADWKADVWSLSLFEANWRYSPILLIDGPGGVLPNSYLQALPNEKLDVPLILGVTREESDFAPGQDVRGLTGRELAEVITQALLPSYGEPFVERLIQTYSLYDNASNFQAQQVYSQILSDATTICPNFYLAGVIDMQRQNAGNGQVYAYIESRAMEKPFCVLKDCNHFRPPYCPQYAFHAVDEFSMIEPAFGLEFAYNLTDRDRGHGKLLRKKMLEFVATGEISDWHRFTTESLSRDRSALIMRELPEKYWVMDLLTWSADAKYHHSRCDFWLKAGFYDSKGLINKAGKLSALVV